MEGKLFKSYLVRVQEVFTICVFVLLLTSQIFSQTISVSGKITSNRFPVQDAVVTLIDEGDTSKQYTTVTDSRGDYVIGSVTSVDAGKNTVPVKFNLGQNYPNPFSSNTAIPYGLNEESGVSVSIYDILGRVVRKYETRRQNAGYYSVLWDGKNNMGQLVANGIYFFRLNAGGESLVKKMVFNQSGNGSFVLPGAYSLSNGSSLHKSGVADRISSTSYTIRISNNVETNPLVVPQEINSVHIASDTTINFNVTTLAVSNIDPDSTHQLIRGFGGSNIVLWRPDMTESEIRTAYGTEDGQLGFSIFRIMVEPESSRWSLSVPSAKLAYELGASIIAAPWHAPSELSENVINENDENINRVRYDKYAEYAKHLNDFVEYMNENGVPIYGISIQNEPDIEESWTSWTSDEMFTFMKDYAHLIEGSFVMAPESFHFARSYSDPILNDPVAEANTDIVCGHIYGSGLSRYPLAEEKGKEVWMTEHLSGEDDLSNSWSWSMNAAQEMNDVMQAGMSAYVWWYIVRYYGPINDGGIDRLSKGSITKKGYVMSQFARFIRPGYYRIASSYSPTISSVELTAYKDPSSSKIVIVAVNKSSAQIDYTFRFKSGFTNAVVTPYTTSEDKNCEMGNSINLTDGIFSYALEASSITTFILE